MEVDLDMGSLEINDKKRRSHEAFKTSEIQPSEPAGLSSSSSSSSSDGSPSPVILRRSTRKKVKTTTPENRRKSNQPQRLNSNSNLKQIENYYLDKKVKRTPSNLETIFEEPHQSEDNVALMSLRKYRRAICFNENATKKDTTKVKKRKMKAKSVSAQKRSNNKKLSLDLLMKKLADLED